MKRKLIIGAIVACLLYVGAVAWYNIANQPTDTVVATPTVAKKAPPTASLYDLWVLTNKERTAHGLRPLKLDARLTESAQSKCTDMKKYHYFAHVSPQGISPWHFIDAVLGGRTHEGENLSANIYPANSVIDAWMNSPEHRENILDSSFNAVGFATCYTTVHGIDSNGLVVVQHFATE